MTLAEGEQGGAAEPGPRRSGGVTAGEEGAGGVFLHQPGAGTEQAGQTAQGGSQSLVCSGEGVGTQNDREVQVK